MSTLGDAIGAVKSLILIEERVRNQAGKLEKLAELTVDIDRRLVRVETTLDIALRAGKPLATTLAIAHPAAPDPSAEPAQDPGEGAR